MGTSPSFNMRYKRASTMKQLKQRRGLAGVGQRHLARVRGDWDKAGDLRTEDPLCCAQLLTSDPQLSGVSTAFPLSPPALGWSGINHLSPLVERNRAVCPILPVLLQTSITSLRPCTASSPPTCKPKLRVFLAARWWSTIARSQAKV